MVAQQLAFDIGHLRLEPQAERETALFRLGGERGKAAWKFLRIRRPVAEAVSGVVAGEGAAPEPAVINDETFRAKCLRAVHHTDKPLFRQVEPQSLPRIDDDPARSVAVRHQVVPRPAVQGARGRPLAALRPREDELRQRQGPARLQHVWPGEIGDAGRNVQFVRPLVAQARLPRAAPAERPRENAPALLRRRGVADGDHEALGVLPGVVDAAAGAKHDLVAARQLLLGDIRLGGPGAGEREQVEAFAQTGAFQAERSHARNLDRPGFVVAQLHPRLEHVAVRVRHEVLHRRERRMRAVGVSKAQLRFATP